MYPVRGQVLRVRAPWVRHYTNSNGDCYIIPNTGVAAAYSPPKNSNKKNGDCYIIPNTAVPQAAYVWGNRGACCLRRRGS